MTKMGDRLARDCDLDRKGWESGEAFTYDWRALEEREEENGVAWIGAMGPTADADQLHSRFNELDPGEPEIDAQNLMVHHAARRD